MTLIQALKVCNQNQLRWLDCVAGIYSSIELLEHWRLCLQSPELVSPIHLTEERLKFPPLRPPDFHLIHSIDIHCLPGLVSNASEFNFRDSPEDKAILWRRKINEVRGWKSNLKDQLRTTKQGELVLEAKPLGPPPWSWQQQQDRRELQLNMVKARAEFVRVVTNANELRLRVSSIQGLVLGIKTEISKISAAVCASKCADMRLMVQLQQRVARLVMED